MSLKANYFKLGLFVIGAIAAGVVTLLAVGSGRWFAPRILMETYFDESVQGLDIGSKIKYRGVVIGEVTGISFTYVRYQLDRAMAQRNKYVLVEAQIEPRLIGSRAAAGDLTSGASAQMEIERGLRVRLAPQGITGTSYLEVDYVDPPPPVLPIDWTPQNVYIPSARSTVQQFVTAASEIIDRLQRFDIEGTITNLNKLLTTANARIDSLDTKGISERATRSLAKLESTLDGLATRRISDELVALVGELRQSNAELRRTLGNPAWQKLPEDASAVMRDASAAMARVRDIVSDPKLGATLGHLERTLGRLDRLTGGGQADLGTTIANLRQITDNLRELTESAKRYPSNVLFGAPPTPLERNR